MSDLSCHRADGVLVASIFLALIGGGLGRWLAVGEGKAPARPTVPPDAAGR